MEPFVVGDWLTIIHLLGAAQGVFLAVILASKRRNSVANKLLAVVMLAFSLELLTTVYHTTGLDEVWPHFIGVTYAFPLLFAPALYLYARTVSEGGHAFRKAYLLHFIPLALIVAYMAPFYLQSGADKLAVLRAPEQHPWTASLTAINDFKFVYSFAYLVIIIRVLKRHRDRIKDAFSSLEHINLAWLRNMVLGGVALWGIALVFYVLGVSGAGAMDPIEGYDDYVALGIAVYVYAIGYLGLRQPEIFAPRTPPLASGAATATGDAVDLKVALDATDGAAGDGAPPSGRPRYARSGMEPDSARRHVQALVRLMEAEKLYRKSDLTLQDLAETLSISPHNLSEVINTQLNKNFYDFVNGYRVEDVKQRLADPESNHLTLLAIGLEAGFNSKSSFNAVFKKHVDMTPSQYREQVAS